VNFPDSLGERMIDLLVEHEGESARDRELLRALTAHDETVRQSAGLGDLRVVREAEAAVRAHPAQAFAFDRSGVATLTAAGRTWTAGHFAPTTLTALRARATSAATARPAAAGRVRLWVIDGGSASTDIGSLQASASEGTLFQVASQFNCLEATGPWVSPIERYLHDSTQGPRASISALPGTLLRHYAAPGPDGDRFVQTSDGRQLDLLAGVCDPRVATVRNGYLMVDEIANPAAFVEALETHFDSIRVGVHDAVEVVLGYDWSGGVLRSPAPSIAQVFTSTLAGGGYGFVSGPLVAVCRSLLRAAYLGTLLSAICLDRPRVVLTLIGGGVFGNPLDLIWDSITWAIEEVAPLVTRDLAVVINGRGLGQQLDRRTLCQATGQRGGIVLEWPHGGDARIHR
jgi:hypothetical protein